MTTEPRGRGFSLWLMPRGEVRDDLAALIADLARRLETEAFEPHVTLLAGLEAPEAEVVERARALASSLSPLTLAPAEIDGTEEHFRCLFLRMAAAPGLRRARSSAARAFGCDPDAPFDPHLSLVYGRLDPAAKAGLKQELSALGLPGFEAQRLHVWRSEGRAGEWREVAAFDLGPASDH
jgi:2'-5' RNA ligase